MHPKTFALMLLLVTAGCIPTSSPSSSTSDAPPPKDTLTADSSRTTISGNLRSGMEWHTLTTDPSILVFDTGDTLRIHATDLRLVTRLTSPLGKPWFIFSGIDSGNTDELRVLYVVTPGDSLDHDVQHSWHMPGRLTDSSDTGTYYEASVFAGEVLRDTVGVIWYDRSLMPDGQWRLNTTLLQLGRPEPDTVVLFGQSRKISSIDLAMRGKCQVLSPVDQRTASH